MAQPPASAPTLLIESAVQMLARVPARNRVVVGFTLQPAAELPAVLPVSDAEINEPRGETEIVLRKSR